MEDEKFLRVGILFIDDEKHVAYVDDKHIELTYKEYELLKYLTINQGIGTVPRQSYGENLEFGITKANQERWMSISKHCGRS